MHRIIDLNLNKSRGKVLIVANSHYPWEQNFLRGVETDGPALKRLFEKLHYEVCLRENLTREEMRKAVEDFFRGRSHIDSDSAIFIFSGFFLSKGSLFY